MRRSGREDAVLFLRMGGNFVCREGREESGELEAGGSGNLTSISKYYLLT
jgi:hypothetical protein